MPRAKHEKEGQRKRANMWFGAFVFSAAGLRPAGSSEANLFTACPLAASEAFLGGEMGEMDGGNRRSAGPCRHGWLHAAALGKEQLQRPRCDVVVVGVDDVVSRGSRRERLAIAAPTASCARLVLGR